jgi:hypothetical protein
MTHRLMRSPRILLLALLALLAALCVGVAWVYTREAPTSSAGLEPLDAPAPPVANADTWELEPAPWTLDSTATTAQRNAVGPSEAPVTAQPKLLLRVVVLAPDGKPLRESAEIEYRERVRRGARQVELPATALPWTGSDNEVGIELAAGLWSFSARASALATRPVDVTLPVSADAPLRLQMAPACTWSGLVLGPNGDPLQDVAVALLGAERELTSVHTNINGRYEFTALPVPGARLDVGDAARPLRSIELPLECAGGGALSPLSLPEWCELALEVDRVGVEHAAVRVLLQSPEGRQSWHEYAPLEQVRLRYLTPGRYRVHVWAGDRRGNREIDLRLDPARRGEPARNAVTIELARRK